MLQHMWAYMKEASHKRPHVWFCFYEVSWTGKSIETEGAGGLGIQWRVIANGYGVSF